MNVMSFVEKLTKALEWGELAGIVVIVIFLWSIGQWAFVFVANYVGSKRRINVNPIIDFHFQPDKGDDVQLVVRTFDKNRDKITSRFERWRRYEDLTIEPQGDYYAIRKIDIARNLPKESYPFKFFLRISDKDKRKYYSRLAESRLIVTGVGDKDNENPGKWRIWFLVPEEEIHQSIASLWHMNHKL